MKMKILAIDTSGLQAGAAIVSFEGTSSYIIGEIFLNARTGEKSYTHSEILMPGVEQLFHLTRLEPKNIDYVAYTCGPGSFTGLRIGAACALGIARSLNIPAIPVPTLDALAYNALETGSECIIVPMLDARRGQVYTAMYIRGEDGKIERKTEFSALSVGELFVVRTDEEGCPPHFKNLLAMSPDFCNHSMACHDGVCCARKIIFLGDGTDANKNAILNAFPNAIFPFANNNRQRAASTAVWAAEKIREGCEFPKTPEILYVRAPQAVREKNEKLEKEKLRLERTITTLTRRLLEVEKELEIS